MKKTITFAIIVAGLLLLLLLYRETEGFFKSGKNGEEMPANWISYNSPAGLFSVSLPGQPEYKSEIERDADGFAVRTNETYVAEDANHQLYTIYFVRYLSGEGQLPLPAGTLLNNTMYEMIDKLKGSHLLAFRKTTFKGKPALEFSIADQDLIMDNVAFVDKGDLYLLSITGKANLIKHESFEKFSQSFEFKD